MSDIVKAGPDTITTRTNWYTITERGMDFAKLGKAVTKETYMRCGVGLMKLKRATTWAIADWLVYGESAYGEDVAQLTDQLELSLGYQNNLRVLARRFPITSRRLEGYDEEGRYRRSVPLTVYQSILSLDEERREEILDKWQLSELLDREDIRAEVKRIKEANLLLADPDKRLAPPLAANDDELPSVVIRYVDAVNEGTHEVAELFRMLVRYADENRNKRTGD